MREKKILREDKVIYDCAGCNNLVMLKGYVPGCCRADDRLLPENFSFPEWCPIGGMETRVREMPVYEKPRYHPTDFDLMP
ncbi:MAG: hypothetical protein WC455_28990 [Dehalococcoidia bacterium]|jgi:hypothetical protein